MKAYREFRGKRKDGGGWVYGSLLHQNEPAVRDVIFGGNPIDPDSWYDVDSDSIGENTGVVDLDGTPVYEGDFLLVTSAETEDRGPELFRAIKFQNGAFVFGYGDTLFSYTEVGVVLGRVVGNETDNPGIVEMWKEADEAWRKETDLSDY